MLASPLSGGDPFARGATIDVVRRRVRLRQESLESVYELHPVGEGLHVVRLWLDSGAIEHVGDLERSTWGWRPPKSTPLLAQDVLRLVARAWNRAPLLKPTKSPAPG